MRCLKLSLLTILVTSSGHALTIDSVTPGLGAEPIAVSVSEGIPRAFAISASSAEVVTYTWAVSDQSSEVAASAFTFTAPFEQVTHPASTAVISITCNVQAGAESATVTWATVTVHDSNQAPTLNGATARLSPETATLRTPLTCTLEGRGLDPDSEDNATLRYVFTWHGTQADTSCDPNVQIQNIVDAPVDPLEQPQDTIYENFTTIERGQSWRCEVAIVDSNGAVSATASSASVSIVNIPPTINPFEIWTSEGPSMAVNLFALPGGLTDEDGDDIGLSYEWRINDAIVPGELTREIDNFPTLLYRMGDRVSAAVTPFDQFENGPTQVSPELKIPIAWEMAFHVDQSGTDTVVIGMHDDADDGADQFDSPSRDIRGTTHNNQAWSIEIDCRDRSRKLLWFGDVFNFLTLAQAYDHRLTMYTADGAPVFIDRTGSLTLPKGQIHSLRVEMIRLYQTEIKMHSGWNLFSLPLGTDPENISAFPASALAYETNTFLRSQQLYSFSGYWTHCSRETTVFQSSATLTDGAPDLKPGWNLISFGSQAAAVADHPNMLIAWRWDAQERAYRRADTLFPGRGYWVYALP